MAEVIIPEDISKKAELTFHDLCNHANPYHIQYDELSDETGINWDEDNAVAVIARAILAERERCAAIAENMKEVQYGDVGIYGLQGAIARTIRRHTL